MFSWIRFRYIFSPLTFCDIIIATKLFKIDNYFNEEKRKNACEFKLSLSGSNKILRGMYVRGINWQNLNSFKNINFSCLSIFELALKIYCTAYLFVIFCLYNSNLVFEPNFVKEVESARKLLPVLGFAMNSYKQWAAVIMKLSSIKVAPQKAIWSG